MTTFAASRCEVWINSTLKRSMLYHSDAKQDQMIRDVQGTNSVEEATFRIDQLFSLFAFKWFKAIADKLVLEVIVAKQCFYKSCF